MVRAVCNRAAVRTLVFLCPDRECLGERTGRRWEWRASPARQAGLWAVTNAEKTQKEAAAERSS